MASQEKIAALVAKLDRLATNNSNEEEAALAASKMQELIDRYKITSADTQSQQDQKEEIDKHIFYKELGPRFTRWKLSLAYRLAKGNGCSAIRTQGLKTYDKVIIPAKVTIIGSESSVQSARYMLKYLVREIERLSQEALERYNDEYLTSKGGKAYANSFKVGAVDAINRRLIEQRKKLTQEVSSTAIAVLNNEYAQSQVWMQSNFTVSHTRVNMRATNVEGYSAGREAGQSIGLGGGQQITRGPKALPGK